MLGLKHLLSPGSSLLPFLLLLSVPLWRKEQAEKSHSRGQRKAKLWLISPSPWRSGVCCHSPAHQAVHEQTAWMIMSLGSGMLTNFSEIFSSRCCKRTKCIETQTRALTLHLPGGEGWNRHCEKRREKGIFIARFEVELGASQRHLLREVQLGFMAELLSFT